MYIHIGENDKMKLYKDIVSNVVKDDICIVSKS